MRGPQSDRPLATAPCESLGRIVVRTFVHRPRVHWPHSANLYTTNIMRCRFEPGTTLLAVRSCCILGIECMCIAHVTTSYWNSDDNTEDKKLSPPGSQHCMPGFRRREGTFVDIQSGVEPLKYNSLMRTFWVSLFTKQIVCIFFLHSTLNL